MHPPTAPLPAPATSTNPNPNLNPNTSGRHRSDAYTPSALRRLLGLRASFSSFSPSRKKNVSKTKEEKSNTHKGKSATSAPSRPRSSWRGGVLGVRICMPIEDEYLHTQPGYARVDSAEHGRHRRMDEAQVPRLAVRLTLPSPSFASPRSPASSEKSRSPYPYPCSPYGAHAHATPTHTPTPCASPPSLRSWGTSCVLRVLLRCVPVPPVTMEEECTEGGPGDAWVRSSRACWSGLGWAFGYVRHE
ncbi:hypothetical protein B0H13DRAFT_857291 [Mycena leptocephala]|nr:hypothetical protein B0H13DRAFT_857291 [Mycena leptocephala]